MPDSRSREPVPRDWGDAFGALPLETPPHGAWQRVAAALPPARVPARPVRWRRPAIALAATAFFAAVIPLMHWRGAETSIPPLQRAPAVATTAPALPDIPARSADAEPASATPVGVSTTQRIADAPSARPAVARPRAPAQPARLDALYTESARLEAVLAQLPDSSTGNVAALTVSADLQDQVSHIDLALSQPALSETTRTALWEERVDTLRQLTGVEATQRWQVALNDTAADSAIY
ncbi:MULTISPECIES: hypothetical protein [unclassified Pseudoxanthomonas]|uniref:hypothetical protein n=1 Tax=unclassified Pseudoxanthomonas TaxID=2645906 RepID=UPI0008E82668|nr:MULTISPECIES: hypothetical protein [unclassified Pseudoxanthomonas]PPJ41787.1 hypothetical protein C0063_00275 [Pseudoxanthomonas sp. KAs_5_3]SFV29661.1 hypothetical protein SAMN05428990_1383 [Pseudoxanthomonas sp. YR558]